MLKFVSVNSTIPLPAAQPAGIKDIAKALGVSIGTVDRALHARPGISPITRAKVLNMARELGYRPNLAARLLSSRQERRIGVSLPSEISSFFNFVREGITEAARLVEAAGFTLHNRNYPRLGEGEIESLEQALEDGLNGIIISPGQPKALRNLIRRASRKGIPVVCVATDAPGTERLAAVSVDPYINGSIAAELTARFLSGRGQIALFTGLLSTVDHEQKLKGFQQVLSRLAPKMVIKSVVETHDNETEAYSKALDVLTSMPDVAGVYVSTANSIPVLRAIEELNLQSRVNVITTDLFPALVPFVENGTVAATIHQRPFNQGRIAFQTLQRFLLEGVTPRPLINIAPHIVMHSNLSLFVPRAQFEPEDVYV